MVIIIRWFLSSSAADGFLGNKKAEVFFLCFQHVGGLFLLSPKGPPSCWRAKPIIAKLYVVSWFAEHHQKFRCQLFVLLGKPSASPTLAKL
jgi:hypothetical protein